MRIRYLLAILLCVVLFGSCHNSTLHVIATSDIHGDFYSYDFLNRKETEGGLARVSTWLKTCGISKNNLIYVDLGDILADTPVTFYDKTANYQDKLAAATATDFMKCSVSAFGNHDLEVGISHYERFFMHLSHPVICANMTYDGLDDTYLPPYYIIKRKGKRIAFIGMLTTEVSEKIPGSILSAFQVNNIQQSAAFWAEYVRTKENPDAVIGLFHASLSEVIGTGISVPGFDAILYGHDHIPYIEKYETMYGEKDSIILANPGNGGNNIVDLTLEFSKKEKPVVSAEMISMNGVGRDMAMLEMSKSRIAEVSSYLDSVAGTFNTDVNTRNYLEGPTTYSDYVHTLLKLGTQAKVSIAFHSVGNIDVPKGKVTMRDFFELFPYPNYISTVIFTPEQLRMILEYSISLFYNNSTRSLEEGYAGVEINRFLSISGIDYVVDLSKPYGKRVKFLCYTGGEEIKETHKIRVAVDNYLINPSHGVIHGALGLSATDLRRMVMLDCAADIRFLAVTQACLAKDKGETVNIVKSDNWHVVK